jgi:hypothetical protein
MLMQILSAAAIAGLELDLKPFEFGVTNKSPEFVEKFPFAKIPTFEGENGFVLLEGASIARYGQCCVSQSITFLTVYRYMISCISGPSVWASWKQHQRCCASGPVDPLCGARDQRTHRLSMAVGRALLPRGRLQ